MRYPGGFLSWWVRNMAILLILGGGLLGLVGLGCGMVLSTPLRALSLRLAEQEAANAELLSLLRQAHGWHEDVSNRVERLQIMCEGTHHREAP